MTGALVMAALLETAGAILAGGDVVKTISKDIIDPALFADSRIFILAMTAALLSAALWINLATKLGAPVSTTHAIVGGVLGGGLAAVGFGAVNWPVMAKIAASWVISPVLGGIIAALFLAFIKYAILYRTDKIGAARRWVPVLVAIMAAAFGAYLALKGLKRIWQPGPWTVVALSAAAFAVTYAVLRPLIAHRSQHLENRKRSVNGLFVIPLIFAAGLLSFAHGANDVANAVGPLAAIVAASTSGDIAAKVEIPWWVMLVGAIGITIGLALFGPKLIRRVGEQITKLNPTRAYSVALSASITVIAASVPGPKAGRQRGVLGVQIQHELAGVPAEAPGGGGRAQPHGGWISRPAGLAQVRRHQEGHGGRLPLQAGSGGGRRAVSRQAEQEQVQPSMRGRPVHDAGRWRRKFGDIGAGLGTRRLGRRLRR